MTCNRARSARRRRAVTPWAAAVLVLGLAAAVAAAPRHPAAPAATKAGNAATERYTPGPPTHPVEVVNYEWTDVDRKRVVPARIYYPRKGAGPFPVILLTHELGQGRESYEYLGRGWASHGYVVVHLHHLGSDAGVFRLNPGQTKADIAKRIKNLFADKQLVLTRALDVYFAFDQIEGLAVRDPLLRGRLDLHEMAVAGHGLGAWTALTAAGLGTVSPDNQVTALPDPRVRALLLMSAAPTNGKDNPNLTFAQIHVPCLEFVTGSAAGMPGRLGAFDQIHGNDVFRVRFRDGDARSFAGRPAEVSGGEHDRALQEGVRVASTAFFDAYLKHNAAAKRWLAQGGLGQAMASEGTVEVRAAP
jgi:dienelactone hydrolase